MHLTDQQLLDSEQNILAEENNSHLQQCSGCSTRKNNLNHFRSQLANTYEQRIPREQWQTLRNEFNRHSQSQQQSKMKAKIKQLQIGLMAVAALLLIVLLVPSVKNSQLSDSLNNELVNIIQENHRLQSNINWLSTGERSQLVSYQHLRIKLQQIDNEIQLSYIDKLPTSQKIALWKLRREILFSSINKIHQSNSLQSNTI